MFRLGQVKIAIKKKERKKIFTDTDKQTDRQRPFNMFAF